MKKHYLIVNEYTAAYTEVGVGETVIFLHGFFGDGWTLHPIIRNLEQNFRCIGLDLLGFGESSKPDIKYLIEHQVEFLQAFMQAKGIHRCYLAGYSYGAWVAAAYAIAICKLVTLDPSASPSSQVSSQPVATQRSSPLLGMALIAPTGIRDDSFVGRYDYLKPLLWETKLVDVVLAGLTPCAYLLGQSAYYQSIRQARRSIVSQPAAKSFLQDRLRPEDAVDTVEQDIHMINCPTLIIAGGDDPHIPLWHAQTYADNIPNAKLDIVAEAGHDLVQTHGEELAQLMRSYW